jgi:hypothetical protein
MNTLLMWVVQVLQPLAAMMSSGLASAVATMLFGGLAGAVATIAITWCREGRRRKKLRLNLQIGGPMVAGNVVTVRVSNGYDLAMTGCWAYITLQYELDDILDPPTAKRLCRN